MTANDPYEVLMSNLKYPDSNRLRAILEDLLTNRPKLWPPFPGPPKT